MKLNATGGSNGMLPYLTLHGMFYDLRILYNFEQSETLIRLPQISPCGTALDPRATLRRERLNFSLGYRSTSA
jgi:hypothetical protein